MFNFKSWFLPFFIQRIITSFYFFSGFTFINAQSCATWGSGEDSIKALQEYSLYREYYKAQKTQKDKDYSEVIEHWRYVYNNAPGARLSPFVDGVKIIENRINISGFVASTLANTAEKEIQQLQILLTYELLIYFMTFQYGIISIVITMISLYYIYKHIIFYRY